MNGNIDSALREQPNRVEAVRAAASHLRNILDGDDGQLMSRRRKLDPLADVVVKLWNIVDEGARVITAGGVAGQFSIRCHKQIVLSPPIHSFQSGVKFTLFFFSLNIKNVFTVTPFLYVLCHTIAVQNIYCQRVVCMFVSVCVCSSLSETFNS
ncbi:unnamed protein product [Gongylonema pulchrum]|uniref:DCB domain-containing protein n=1 Tax=Gongylonema pulchrum TaxID=637853 RepID=A0A183DIZ8_9BILA|nr:unnamed protein product [Gongylonema pulchrum]